MKQITFKKEITLHLLAFILFFAFLILFKQYFVNSRLMVIFIVGGLIGTFLPDVDHFIYAIYLRPKELTSQRIAQKLNSRQILDAVKLLYSTQEERVELVFHNAFFQALFVIFSFLVVTSSGSALGSGIVLAFLLHLLVDEVVDLKMRKNVNRWFAKNFFQLKSMQQVQMFIYGNALILLILGILF